MALVLKDRVQETATANTTVSFSLAGAVTGFQTFSSTISNTDTTYYSATDASGNWEVGLGTYATSGNLLTRTTIFSSSNTGSAVTFSGTVNVFITYPASQSVYEDASNIMSGFPISGGSINNTPIGATTANTGSFTTWTATGVITANTTTNSQTYTTTGAGTITITSGTAGSIDNMNIGATTRGTGAFTTLGANGAVTVQTTTNNQSYTTTGAGTITITSGTAGNINNLNIGATTRGTGAFTTLGANGAVTVQTTTNNQSYTTTGAGTITMSSGTAGSIDNMNIGATTSGTGKFTSLDCTSLVDTGVLARNAGRTSNTTINATTTYTTGGLTLLTQSAAVGSTWRIRAFGQYTAANSATARTARVACFWGATQLTAITSTVLTSTAQTTQWQCEFTLTSSSTTAIWTTGTFLSRVGSATALAIDNATPASTGSLTTTSTLDLRFSMSSATPADSWIVQSVIMERLE